LIVSRGVESEDDHADKFLVRRRGSVVQAALAGSANFTTEGRRHGR